MSVPLWAWYAFGISFFLTLLFLLLDYLVIRRNALGNTCCLIGTGGADRNVKRKGALNLGGPPSGYDFTGLGNNADGSCGNSNFSCHHHHHHKRGTNMVLSV